MNILEDKTPSPPTGEITLENLRKLDAANQKQKQDFKKKKQERPAWAMTK